MSELQFVALVVMGAFILCHAIAAQIDALWRWWWVRYVAPAMAAETARHMHEARREQYALAKAAQRRETGE